MHHFTSMRKCVCISHEKCATLDNTMAQTETGSFIDISYVLWLLNNSNLQFPDWQIALRCQPRTKGHQQEKEAFRPRWKNDGKERHWNWHQRRKWAPHLLWTLWWKRREGVDAKKRAVKHSNRSKSQNGFSSRAAFFFCFSPIWPSCCCTLSNISWLALFVALVWCLAVCVVDLVTCHHYKCNSTGVHIYNSGV